MEKKILKWYEAPEVEIIEAEVEAQLLAGSPGSNPFDDNTGDTEEVE
jgi:hypothetical protein